MYVCVSKAVRKHSPATIPTDSCGDRYMYDPEATEFSGLAKLRGCVSTSFHEPWTKILAQIEFPLFPVPQLPISPICIDSVKLCEREGMESGPRFAHLNCQTSQWLLGRYL